MMYLRSPLSLVALLLMGLGLAACGDDPAPSNTPPILTGPFTETPDVTSGTQVALSLEATDADGDSITYEWVQTPATPAGAFSDPTAPSPAWTAPEVTAATSFQLGVAVSDGKSGTIRRSVTILVRPRPPNNRPPVITAGTPSASPSSVTGSVPVQITLTATDPDSDQLTYSWLQEPATPVGSFSNLFVSSPTWTSPVVTTTTRFTLAVTVSDGRGGSVSSTVNVDVAPPVPGNNPPTLTGPTANPTTLDFQQTTNLTLTATDSDGDPLTYAWTQSPATPAGSFSSTSVASPTWTAPRVATNTPFQLRVAVSDGRGGTTNGSASVSVNANSPPTITAGPSASSSTIDEQTSVTLSVTASDANGDPLTYTWTQTSPASPMGSFSSTSVANPTWTAPDVTASGTYTLRVTISDGPGGNVQGSVNITVQKVNQPPTVNTINGPSTLLAGNTGTFTISASDPDGDALTYSWSQTDPPTPLGTFVGSTTNSSAQWYSPALSTQTSFTLSVSVTDGQSTPVVRTITFPVTMPHYPTDIQSIWDTACVSCHGTNGTLSLDAPGSYANLINVTSAICPPDKRITPSDPANSALIRKIEGTTCGGTRMPRNNPGYFDANPGLVVRIRSWVLAGAPND
jgi:hypothetical protein